MKPINKYNVNDLTHSEWLEARKEGIGGSDTATILGLNPYKSAYELWLEKRGEIETGTGNNEAIHFGNKLENLVANEFQERSGLKVRRNNFLMAHPQHDFLRANIDREVIGTNELLECKTTSLFNANKWDNERVPANYIIQVQHYMAVMNYKAAYVAVLIGGQRFKYTKIERHEDIINEIIEQAGNFFNYHVLEGVPPAIDGSKAAASFLNKEYLESETKEIALAASYEQELAAYFDIKDKIKHLQQKERAITNRLKLELKEAERATVSNYLIDWKPVTTNRVDVKKLKKEYPEIHQELLNQTHSRRMTIKERKE